MVHVIYPPVKIHVNHITQKDVEQDDILYIKIESTYIYKR